MNPVQRNKSSISKSVLLLQPSIPVVYKLPSIKDRGHTDRVTILANPNPNPNR